MINAIDGQINGGEGTDRFRIKIWDKETGDFIYDSLLGAADTVDQKEITGIAGSNIVIHVK